MYFMRLELRTDIPKPPEPKGPGRVKYFLDWPSTSEIGFVAQSLFHKVTSHRYNRADV